MQPKNLKLFILVFLPLTLAISILTSSGKASEIPKFSNSDTYPTDEWLTSTPEEQGMNSTYISMMYEFIFTNSLDIDSVLIARNGIIVEEAYLEDSVVNEALTQPHSSRNFETCIYKAQGKLRNWYSTTKSVTSILIGIAIQNGFIDNVSQTFFEFFPDKWNSSYDPRKLNITIEHLLTMTSGVPWEVANSVPWWFSYYSAPNYIDSVLELDLLNDPGDPFIDGSGQYSTDASNLLTAIINRSTGLYPEDFAKQYLFEPLGIPDEDWGWYKDYEGINWGGTGLCMNRTSMAKIAYLCLREGNWDGTQILSQEYIQKATTDFDGMISEVYQPYGYSIWLNNYTSNISWYYASGAFGQNFYVIPELDLIVLFNAYSTTGTNQTQILTDYIIASIIIEEEAGAPSIPGYEPFIVIGATIIAYIGIVVLKKKKL